MRWRSGAQRPPRLSSAAAWWSATSRWTTSSQLNASTDCSVSVFVSVGLFVLTSPTLFSEERESSGETVSIPEVVRRRGAGETSGSDGHDQGDQTQQQRITQGHERGGPLRVRQPHSKMFSQIKDNSIWPYPDQFSEKTTTAHLCLILWSKGSQTLSAWAPKREIWCLPRSQYLLNVTLRLSPPHNKPQIWSRCGIWGCRSSTVKHYVSYSWVWGQVHKAHHSDDKICWV